MKAYENLEARKKRISALNNAMGILHWDQETMMPDGAAPARASVLAELSVMIHELETADELPDLLATAESGTASCSNAWPWALPSPWSRQCAKTALI
jgi:carboxypeptidase Taq